MEKLMELLKNCCPEIQFEGEERLITDNVIDSVDLVGVISDIEDAFGISISMEEVVPENFDSVDAMWSMIQRLL
ncbi:MAG: acyl carrier protein [Clostridiales bacterium]|nr:acyl carrier protein [Clostridiales bacterium]